MYVCVLCCFFVGGYCGWKEGKSIVDDVKYELDFFFLEGAREVFDCMCVCVCNARVRERERDTRNHPQTISVNM